MSRSWRLDTGGAGPVLSTLAIGIPVVHWRDLFSEVEVGIMYLLVLVLFVVRGGGLYALHDLIRRRPMNPPHVFGPRDERTGPWRVGRA